MIDMLNRIKVYRAMLNLSQHRLAKKVGVTRMTINAIENQKTIPSLRVANDIAIALECKICDVFIGLEC